MVSLKGPALFMLIILLGLPLTGCTMIKIYATGGNEIVMSGSPESGGESFTVSRRQMFDYTNAIDIQEILKDEFGTGHRFVNVNVKWKSTFADSITNLLTLFLASSRTFEISGEKVPME